MIVQADYWWLRSPGNNSNNASNVNNDGWGNNNGNNVNNDKIAVRPDLKEIASNFYNKLCVRIRAQISKESNSLPAKEGRIHAVRKNKVFDTILDANLWDR